MSFRCQERNREYQRNWQRKNKLKRNPFKNAFSVIKQRAKKKGLEFNLKYDFHIPNECPVLGIPITIGGGMGNRNNSPSVDRVDNTKGYTEDNIRVISYRANRLKSDMTEEECRSLLKDFEIVKQRSRATHTLS